VYTRHLTSYPPYPVKGSENIGRPLVKHADDRPLTLFPVAELAGVEEARSRWLLLLWLGSQPNTAERVLGDRVPRQFLQQPVQRDLLVVHDPPAAKNARRLEAVVLARGYYEGPL
jgi:hypothetical protein